MSVESPTDSSGGTTRFRPSRALMAFLILLFALGFVARAVPLFDSEVRLFQQFPTEDGYLMLTIARNLAIGNGFSVSGGETPTNGTQPLLTLVYTVGFLISGGGRVGGVLFAQIVQLILSALGAFLLFRLGTRVLKGRPEAGPVSAVAAAIWYTSSLTIVHTANCLETGPYGVIALLVALAFTEPSGSPIWSVPKCLAVGTLLGAVFWTRNDGCFLILSACLTYLYMGRSGGKDEIVARFKRTLIFGATSVAVASPWLIFNYVNFGHIMPVSGRAESLTASFGANMAVLPVILLEYFLTFVPIPKVAESNAIAIIVCAIGVLGCVAVIRMAWTNARPEEKNLMVLASIYLICLSMFYGLYFGAGWFMPRYIFPASSFVILFSVLMAFTAFRKIMPNPGLLRAAAGVVVIVFVVGFNARIYKQGEAHMHFQVVKWLQKNVAEEVWVGAIQTGTIGFFHDRTINLDGKVNPAAYDALIAKRQGDYVVKDTPIQYLADWTGMIDWMTIPAIAENFEVLVHDKEQNLGVLKRKTTPTDG